MASDTPPPPVAERPGAVGKAALILTGAMGGVGSGTLSAILPAIEGEFGPGSGFVTITMTLTILGMGMLIGSLIGGWAADRLGRRVVMIFAGLLFGIGGCGIMLADSLADVVIGRLVAGMAFGAMSSAAFAVIGDSWDEDGRNKWTGMLTGLGAVAGMVLSILAAVLADISWRSSFIIYAIGIAAALCALVGIKGKARVQELEHGKLPLGIVPGLVIFGLIAGAIAIGTAAYLPHRFVEVGVETNSARALFMLSGAVTVMVVSLCYGAIRKFLSLEVAFVIAALLSCLGLTMMALMETPWLISLGLAIEGIGLGLLVPSLTIYAINHSTEANRGRMIGLVKGAFYAGPFLFQFALDPLRLREGAGAVLLVLAGSAILLALWCGWKALRARPASRSVEPLLATTGKESEAS
ncbi:MAG: MFS transporter [Pseudomonadota bacterium]